MTGRDHSAYQQDIGAYLLAALTDLERQAFERHTASCGDCRDELEFLRPAAEALPRSVEQLAPPPGLKTALLEIVEQEAAEDEPARDAVRAPRQPARRRGLGERLFGGFTGLRPVLAVAVLALGLAAGYGAAQLGSDGDGARSETFAATVDQSRVPQASGRLQVEGSGENGGILRVQGLPDLEPLQVYQAWVQRGDGQIVPQPTFEVERDGGAAVAIPDDIEDAQSVLVSREPRGGSRAPTEEPILSVPL